MNLRRFVCGAAIVVFLLLISFLLSFPGIVYRHHDEIDIRSGRIRRTDFIFGVRTSQTVENTAFSKILQSSMIGGDQSDWHRVNTFQGTTGVSPHHAYHGAISQMQRCEMLWQVVPFADDAKHEFVETILELWQSDGAYFAADRYIDMVEEVAWRAENQAARKVTVADLPAWRESCDAPPVNDGSNGI